MSTYYPRRQWWTTRSGGGCPTSPPMLMNCLSWNYRGLGQQWAVLELTDLVKKHSPSILFLMETRSKDHKLKTLCSKLHLENVFIESRVNTGGGLALYLKDGINLKVLDSTPTFIDAIGNLGMDDAWQLTSFYPTTANWEHSWAQLKHPSLKLDLPWLCVGDFNEITKDEEKKGGPDRPEQQMREFREALDFCGFRNLGFLGAPFNWCNNQFDREVTWIWLDRGVATPAWTQLFHHIQGTLSDHCPLWLYSDNENVRFYKKKSRPFRF